MARLYIYVVDRDFGFAPNPFHGTCTLATCKPRIRRSAQVGDWVMGVGGRRLNATGKCIFGMRVDDKVSFDAYWTEAEFQRKKPVRNGSQAVLVGDNIYHREGDSWIQEDSHHSSSDGSTNPINLSTDTSVDAVLVSRHFYYFGANAPDIPDSVLSNLGYRNGRNHRVFELPVAKHLLDWLSTFRPNFLHGEPTDFQLAHARYSGRGSQIHRE
jgi:hypothetical protein